MNPLETLFRRLVLSVVLPARTLVVLLVAVAGVPLASQPLERAGDARTAPGFPTYFPIRPLAEVNGALLMATDDGVHGVELWRTDGTAEGTWMVRDICPGSCSSRPLFTAPESRNGGATLLFFSAIDGVHGEEPWVSDGTFEGTHLVADLKPGVAGSRPEWFRWSGDEMLFTADDGVHGNELWSAGVDGSTATLVADIRLGPESSRPSALVGGNGSTMFSADDGTHGREPWISDGTPGGTAMLLDLVDGADSSIGSVQSFPGYPTQTAWDGSRWWFQSGALSSYAAELWVTDGTPENTERIEDSLGDPVRPYYEIVVGGGVVFFRNGQANAELWRTDGSDTGTYRVADLNPDGDDRISGLTSFGNRVFFRSWRTDTGSEPWVSDGTEPGTMMLADIAPGPDSSVLHGNSRLESVIGDRVFFLAGDSSTGDEPWITDGTPAGTHAIVDARPGPDASGSYSGSLPFFAEVDGRVVFFAYAPTPLDHEPWVTTIDGDGATLLDDLDTQSSSSLRVFTELQAHLVGVGGFAYWRGLGDDDSSHAWRTQGKAEDAQPLPPPPTQEFTNVWQLVPLSQQGLLLFVREAGGDIHILRSDGSEPGTSVLADFSNGSRLLGSDRLGVYTEDSSLRATDGDTVWTVDPLTEALQVVTFDDALFLVGSDFTSYGLWRVDPPFDSAVLVAAHEQLTRYWDVPDPTAAANQLFYAAGDAATGFELWVSDGAGSSLVLDIAPGPQSSLRAPSLPVLGHFTSRQRAIVPHDAGVLFTADDGVHGQELWRSDGTSQQTEIVVDLRSGAVGSEPLWLTPVGEHVFFVADDGIHGRELWRTDGSEIGTELFDLVPGAESSAPAWLIAVDGVLHFVFSSADHGVELWRLPPGAMAPELVEDLHPGAGSSSPSSPTLVERRLFVIANDGLLGYEPWSFVVPSRLPSVTLASQLAAGGVELVLRVEDPHDIEVPDGDGAELELNVPAPLTVLGAEASLGTADIVGNAITWSGSVPGDESLVIVVRIGFPPGSETSSWSLQGELRLDTDHDGVNDRTVPTDDAGQPGVADPTVVEPPSDNLIFGDAFERGELSSWSSNPP